MGSPMNKNLMVGLQVVVAIGVYIYFYDRIVFEQRPMHISSIFSVFTFFTFFGLPFFFTAALISEWRIWYSFALSVSTWVFTFFIMLTFRNSEFTTLYPDSLQCMAVPITMYPALGFSCVFGHFIGRLLNSFKGSSEEVDYIEKQRQKRRTKFLPRKR